MNWKLTAALCLACIVVGWLFHHGVWPGRPEAGQERDTVVAVAPFTLPPAVVTPNPAPVTRVIRDRAREDSLLSRIADRDSLIRELMATAGTEQTFESSDPTGLAVSGLVTVMYSPLERHFLTQIELDPIRVPVTTVTVTQTIIEERLAWEWLVGTTATGIVIGALIAQ